MSRQCCCGGCQEKPWLFLAPEGSLQELSVFCCSCIPKSLCVTYGCTGEESVSVNLDVSHPCSPGDAQSVYRGDIPIRGTLVAIEIGFTVEDGVCSLYLTGDNFYSQPDPIVIDADVREILCPRCQPCIDDVITFTIDDDCSGAATVTVRPASNTSLPPLPNCCDCPDPCDANPYAEHEDQPCAPPCDGCSCICSSACITVIEQGTVNTYVVALCDYTYQIANGMSVSIVGNASGCCELELDTGGIVPDEQPDNVAIGDLLNPCPRPTARWDFTDSNKTAPLNEVSVIFSCVVCGNCGEIVTSQCCVDSVPRILTASIDGGGDCCGSFELKLIYNDLESAWIGSHPTALCGHEIELRLTCDPGSWGLSFTGLPCTAQSDDDASPSCDPVELEFSIPANGIGCCGEGDVDGGTLTITVTE